MQDVSEAKPVSISGKEAPHLMFSYIEPFSSTAHHGYSNWLQYALQNKPSLWVVTGKLKINYKSQK